MNALHYDVQPLLFMCTQWVLSHNVGSLIPAQCPGNEAAMLAECHMSVTCHMTIVVFFLPVWTQVLTLTISRMMSCGWTLNTPMGKGSVQYSLLWSVYVVSSPDSYWGSGNEACIWCQCELVGCFVLSRYFTWDTAKFPNSAGMINNLAAKGRKVWECLQVKT